MADEIYDGIYVGDIQDAINWNKGDNIITVLTLNFKYLSMFTPEEAKLLERKYHYVKVIDNNFTHFNQDALDKVVKIVLKLKTQNNNPILIHCYSGIERSPFTVAWVLFRLGYIKDFYEAYNLVKQKHPQTQDRTHWITPRMRKIIG